MSAGTTAGLLCYDGIAVRRPLDITVMTGDNLSRPKVRQLRLLGWGRMFVREDPWPYAGEPWGFDNGAYVYWRHGLPFDVEEYLRRFDLIYQMDQRPYLAVLPDLLGEGSRSLEFSFSWYFRLGVIDHKWPWYLALQDGMQPDEVDRFLRLCQVSGLFLGGTNDFKQEASAWCEFAHERGLLFHYARAGTQKKVNHAFEVGADSIDSCFPLWTKERWATFMAQLTNPQLVERA